MFDWFGTLDVAGFTYVASTPTFGTRSPSLLPVDSGAGIPASCSHDHLVGPGNETLGASSRH